MNLFRRFKAFRLENVHPEVAARGLVILKDLKYDDIRVRSECAAAFYKWVSNLGLGLYM